MLCDYCQNLEAVIGCEICGSNVCREDKLETGCRACNGGEKKFLTS